MRLENNRARILKREQRLKLGLVLMILISTFVAVLVVPGLLVSFLLAFVISYMFKPLANYLERKSFSRTLAVTIPFVIAGVIIVFGTTATVSKLSEQAASLQTELPTYTKVISESLKKRTKRINTALAPFYKTDVTDKATQWGEAYASSLLNTVPNWLGQLLTTLILAPFFAFFMLIDGRSISKRMLSLVPNNVFEMALNLSYQINRQLGSFIRARLLESAIVGLVVYGGLSLLGLPYPSFLAIFAGVTNLIPYVGPILGAIPGILLGLAAADATQAVALASLVYFVAQLIDMLVIVPLVVAKIVDLHPVTVVVVIIIGGFVMGILGMIISVPVASIIKLTFSEIYDHVIDFPA